MRRQSKVLRQDLAPERRRARRALACYGFTTRLLRWDQRRQARRGLAHHPTLETAKLDIPEGSRRLLPAAHGAQRRGVVAANEGTGSDHTAGAQPAKGVTPHGSVDTSSPKFRHRIAVVPKKLTWTENKIHF